jgi:dTDP-4-amino-4,6-dideoxygalactose transaminase
MPGYTHSYYVYSMALDVAELGVSRTNIVRALEAEGVPGMGAGYTNLHLLPMYQKKIAYGSSGFPWSSDICHRDVSYQKGICPVGEELHDTSFFALAMCLHDLSDEDTDLISNAFRKVWSQLDELREE